MPQIALRPFMARTMVEDGERVKVRSSRRRHASPAKQARVLLWKWRDFIPIALPAGIR